MINKHDFWISCPTIEEAKTVYESYEHPDFARDVAEIWNRYREDFAFNIIDNKIFSCGSVKNLPLWGVSEYYRWNGDEYDIVAIATDTRTTAQKILDLEKELHDLKEVRRLEEEKERIKKTAEKNKELTAIRNAIKAFNEKWSEDYHLIPKNDIKSPDEYVLNIMAKFLE